MDETPKIPMPFSEAMVQFIEAMRPVAEAAAGYKANLIGLGFSAENAEVMASQFHGHMVRCISKFAGASET